MHNECDPKTYLLFPCDPVTRYVHVHAEPVPDMTFDAYTSLPETAQRYPNHAGTLLMGTQKQVVKTRNDLAEVTALYRIHAHQLRLQKTSC